MAKTHTITELNNTINFMDALSQEGFSKIAGIAGMAANALKDDTDSENMRQVFYAIKDLAQDINNSINCEAENVGCNYISERLATDIANHKAAMEAKS